MTLVSAPFPCVGAGPGAACIASEKAPGAFDLVHLSSRDGLQATFAPQVDMTCCSLLHRGVELVSRRYGLEAYAGRGITMGMSLMHPWADRLSGWSYTACGVPVRLPPSPLLHTDGWGLPLNGVHAIGGAWVLQDSGTTRDSAWLDARLPFDRPRQLELFPFPHRLSLHAEVTDGSLSLSLRMDATGGVAVPVCFGYRLYFGGPQPEDRRTIVLPARRRVETDERLLPTGAMAQREMSVSSGFDGPHEVFAFDSDRRLTIASGARRVTIDSFDGLPLAQVQTRAGEPEVMVEALTAAPDALTRNQFAVATPDRPYRAALRVSIDEIPRTSGAAPAFLPAGRAEPNGHGDYELSRAADLRIPEFVRPSLTTDGEPSL